MFKIIIFWTAALLVSASILLGLSGEFNLEPISKDRWNVESK